MKKNGHLEFANSKAQAAGLAPRKNVANIVIGVAVSLVVIAAISIVAFHGMAAHGAHDGASLIAIVHDGDGIEHELPLASDSETEITTSKGTNIVVVENGAVSVREADCKNQDCVRQGRIDAPGRQIICLPHELWIEIVPAGGAPGQMDVDSAADAAKAYDVVAR